jgi:hypothetical protein
MVNRFSLIIKDGVKNEKKQDLYYMLDFAINGFFFFQCTGENKNSNRAAKAHSRHRCQSDEV